MTRHTTNADTFEPIEDRWEGGAGLDRVVAPHSHAQPLEGQERPVTWPSAVYSPQQGAHWGYNTLSQHGQLTLNVLLAPDLPRPMNAGWTRWPGWQHVWPGATAGGWSALGFWAHTEPLHPVFAAGFGLAGAFFMYLGAVGITATNRTARDPDDASADTTGARALLGLGGAAFAGAAASGAGFSGIGCMLAFGSVTAAYVGANGWRHARRHQAIRGVVDYVNAANPGPLPPGLPLSIPAVPIPPASLNAYDDRIQYGLRKMNIDDTWLGSPRRIADGVWQVPFELGASANMSPKALAKKEAVLATNIKARRVEIEPTHGPHGLVTIYDGPDRTDDDYPWGEQYVVTSTAHPVVLGFDDAGRQVKERIGGRMLVAGGSGNGKSSFINSLLLSTLPCTDLVRIGIDCKPGAPELGPYEPVMHFLARTPDEAMAVLYGIREVITERGLVMAEMSVPSELNEDGVPVRKWRSEFGPRIVVAMDELAEVTRWQPGAAKLMESNRQLGRFVQVDALDATQAPSADAMGGKTDGRQQYDFRAGFASEGVVDNMLFGQGAAGRGWKLEILDGIGKFLAASPTLNKPRVYKGLFADDLTVAKQVAKWAGRVPDLDERSAEAFQRGIDAYYSGASSDTSPDGPRGGGHRVPDVFDVVDDFRTDRPVLTLVPRYPSLDGRPGEVIETKYRAMWELLGSYGADGALAKDLAAKQIPGQTSESKVRALMNHWIDRGFVMGDGQLPQRFVRTDRLPREERREA